MSPALCLVSVSTQPLPVYVPPLVCCSIFSVNSIWLSSSVVLLMSLFLAVLCLWLSDLFVICFRWILCPLSVMSLWSLSLSLCQVCVSQVWVSVSECDAFPVLFWSSLILCASCLIPFSHDSLLCIYCLSLPLISVTLSSFSLLCVLCSFSFVTTKLLASV